MIAMMLSSSEWLRIEGVGEAEYYLLMVNDHFSSLLYHLLSSGGNRTSHLN
jgi:hypothetical protein